MAIYLSMTRWGFAKLLLKKLQRPAEGIIGGIVNEGSLNGHRAHIGELSAMGKREEAHGRSRFRAFDKLQATSANSRTKLTNFGRCGSL